MKYRIYLETDLNRVFTQSLAPIAAAELDVVLTHRLATPGTHISSVDEGRTTYLAFDYDGGCDALAKQVAMLSATAALFIEQSPMSLEPVPLDQYLRYGTDLVTAQRYKGKTSERLTRLMLNLALAANDAKAKHGWSVLDPMCGRGTTLNWVLLYGGRAVGLDVDRRALDNYATFLEQWAKGNRFPHKIQRYKKQNSESRHFDFTVASDRTRLASKSGPDIRVFHAPADSSSVPVGKHSMMVSDLPYGIQHQARSDAERTPTTVGELVENVMSQCAASVRTRGSVALAWNVKSLAQTEMAEILAGTGFELIVTAGFEHRVDRTILRDVALARRVS